MNTKIIAIIIATTVGASSLLAHSKAIKPEYVDMLLTPYFKLQETLAGDNLAGSKESAGSFRSMLGHGPSFDEAPSLLDLQDQANAIINASDLKGARAAFLTLSTDLTEMIGHVGNSDTQDIYQMNCPMAFEGKGGDWLQNSKDLTNPYFGSMMLHCGTVQAHLAKKKSEHSE